MTLQNDLPIELASRDINLTQYGLIIKMIITIINNEFNIDEDGRVDRNMAMLLIDYFNRLADQNKKFTEEDMRQCFEASRIMNIRQTDIRREFEPVIVNTRYRSFEDYIKSLTK